MNLPPGLGAAHQQRILDALSLEGAPGQRGRGGVWLESFDASGRPIEVDVDFEEGFAMGSRVGNGVVVVTAAMEERASYWVARRQRRLVWMMDLCCIGCVAASLLVLMLSGEFPLALLWTNVVALIFSIFFGRTDFVTRHRRWFNVLLVSSLVFFVARSFLYERYLYEAMLFLATIEVVKLFQRSEATDILQIIAMALVSMIVGAIANPDLVFAFSFLVMLILMTWCLLLLHFYRDACKQVDGAISMGIHPRTILPGLKRHLSFRFVVATTTMSFALFFCTTLIFLLFPRMGLGFLFRGVGGSNVTGFADTVTLGQHGRINTDSTVVARVEIPGTAGDPPPLLLYLRGRSLSLYESGRWRKNYVRRMVATGAHRSKVPLPVTGRGIAGDEVAQEARIYLEPLTAETPVVPAPMGAIRIDFSPSHDITGVGKRIMISQDMDGDILHTARARFRLIYDVDFQNGNRTRSSDPRGHDQRYLHVPPELEGRLSALAGTWREGRDTAARIAARFEANLRRSYRYTLDSPRVEDDDPITSFLFQTKEGHCEYFATAMALLLRTQDIPTRIVNGFAGGEWNRPGGFFTIRNSDAHSWVEIYDPDQGWMRFDPTPRTFEIEPTGFWASVQRYLQNMKLKWLLWVVSYNADRQMELFYSARSSWNEAKDDFNDLSGPIKGLLFAAVLVLLSLVFVWWRKRRERRGRRRLRRARNLPALDRLERRLARSFRRRHPSEPRLTYLLRAADHLDGRDGVDPSVGHALRRLTHPVAQQLYDPRSERSQRRALNRSLRKLARRVPWGWGQRSKAGQELVPEPPSIRGQEAA